MSAPLALNTGTTISDFDSRIARDVSGKTLHVRNDDRPSLGGGGAAHAAPERDIEAAKRALIRSDAQETRRRPRDRTQSTDGRTRGEGARSSSPCRRRRRRFRRAPEAYTRATGRTPGLSARVGDPECFGHLPGYYGGELQIDEQERESLHDDRRCRRRRRPIVAPRPGRAGERDAHTAMYPASRPMFIQSIRSRRAAPGHIAQLDVCHSIAAIAPMTSPHTAICPAN